MKLECVVFGMVVAAGWPEQLVALKQQRQVQDDRANWTDEDQPVTTDGKNTMKHQIRYYGTTDSAIEVDAMAQVLRKISKKQNVHIASVIGGLSCLNLFVGLEYKHVTATFYDYVPGTTGLAKMYIELIKLAKTRQEFLEMFYARRLHPSDFPVTTWNQRSTFYDRPCDTAFADSVAALLVSDGAHKIYMRELLPLVGCARKSGALHPKTWPVYTKDMRPDKHVEMSNLALTGSTYTDILKNATDKVTTLWFGQAGFLKNDGNFQQAKNAIQRATFQFHTLSIAADVSICAPTFINQHLRVTKSPRLATLLYIAFVALN